MVIQEPQRFLYEGSWPLRLPNLINNSNTSTSVSRRSQTLLTQGFMNSIEEDNIQPLIIDYSSNTSSSSSNSTKQKAINFQAFKIIIGQWTRVAVYPNDIMAKFYFQKKKLIWEMIDPEEPGINMARMKKKIEISWDDVSSFRTQFHARDQTEILEVELTKPPTFFQETDRKAGLPTQWEQVDQDFTQNQSSIFRRHILYFQPGVLQENLKKLLSDHSFWSELIKVTFPFHKSTCFDNSYGSTNKSSSYNHGQTLSLNDNNVNLLHHSQGLDEGNIQMARQVSANNGRQINPYAPVNSWNNTPNELRVTQAIPWSSQMISEGYNMASSSQISNPMNQDESGTKYMYETRYGQANGWNNIPNELRGFEAITPSSQMINQDYNMIKGSQISNPMNEDESERQYMKQNPYLAGIMRDYDHMSQRRR